jgi:hypothetical protein
MKFFIKNKKGELSTQQIIMLIILIASFLVILFFLFRLNLGQETDKELCRNSVVTRGSSVIPADSVPLKCSREYVCLSEDGGCEQQSNPVVKKVKSETEIYSELANQMAECWWMFGEGKLDYVGKNAFIKENYCSICSQIAFDDSLTTIDGLESGQISQDELYDFLTIANYSQDKTYAEYLFGTNDLRMLKQEVSKNQSGEASFGTINIGENQYWVVMGITSEVAGRGWKIALGAVAGGIAGIFTGGILPGAVVGAVFVGGAGEVAGQVNPEIIAIPVEGDGVPNNFMAPTIVEMNSEKFGVLNCADIRTLS